MNCASCAALLDGYVDGALSPEERAIVEQHLGHCAQCAQYVEDILAIEANFPLEEVPVPEGFAQSVMTQVAQHPRQVKKAKQWQRFALPAVACFAIVLFAGSDLLPQQSQEPTSDIAAPMQVAETAMESRAVAEIPQDLPAQGLNTYFFSQSQVGDLLEGYDATQFDDGTVGYTLGAEDFAAFVSQADPTLTQWEPGETYWVVVTTP